MIKTAQLISTAIMKTDIIGFSNIVGELSDFELSQLLEEHKKFIIKIIYKYDGSIIKGEGDAFFISFSSVTSAIESAVEIQSKLKKIRENSDDKFRLSLKIIISLGDVLHKNNDVYGDSVNIISRIEDITPPDEVYITEPTYLTVKKKQINIESVGSFEFKGFSGNHNIYRVVLGRKTIVLDNQFILFSDLQDFVSLYENYELLEKTIDNSDIMFQHVIKRFNGNLRNVIGDAYIITFEKINDLINSLDYINKYWSKVCYEFELPRMRLGCHKGTMSLYRSCIWGMAFNVAARLESMGKNLDENKNSENHVITHTSSTIRDEALEYNNDLKKKFRRVSKKELLIEINPATMNQSKKNFKKCTYSYIA